MAFHLICPNFTFCNCREKSHRSVRNPFDIIRKLQCVHARSCSIIYAFAQMRKLIRALALRLCNFRFCIYASSQSTLWPTSNDHPMGLTLISLFLSLWWLVTPRLSISRTDSICNNLAVKSLNIHRLYIV